LKAGNGIGHVCACVDGDTQFLILFVRLSKHYTFDIHASICLRIIVAVESACKMLQHDSISLR